MAAAPGADDAVLRGIKSFLRSVLISVKDGIPAYKLQREYKEMVGEFLPFRNLGFPTLEDFIQSIPDVVELRWRHGELFYQVVPDEATAHIHDLVSKQKSNRKLKKPARRPRGRGGARFYPRGQFPTAERAPRPRFPVTRRTLLPSPMGLPTFRSPAPSMPIPSLPSPITVKVGNSATGSRTVRVGSRESKTVKINRIFSQAVTAANDERNEPKSASRFEVPPRFRRQMETANEPPPPPPPARRPSGPKVTFPTVENGEMYIEVLNKYSREISQGLKFETMPARVGSATGYLSSVKLKNTVYGSEDVYRTAKEAEEACAMMAVGRLGLLDAKHEVTKSKGESKQSMTTYPPEQLRIVRSRVKEILSNRRNGLWGTRIPHEYKEKYKDEPPPDLLAMIRQWTDIARVELVAATDRDIVYPVFEDLAVNKEPETKYNDKETGKKEEMTKERIETAVKDLISLHKDTVKNQNSVLKSLVIPREHLLTCDEEVTVYMTYIYDPGYFCVQREDSLIDEMSEEIQKFCQSKSAPAFDELQKGQFCAGIYSGDNNWTRAEILLVKDSPPSVELLFVDYGNVETTSPESIRWLSPDTASVPVQAANCSLYGIVPLETEAEENEWSRASKELFAELVREEALIAIPKQLGYDETIYDIELFLKSDPSVSINQKLVERGVVRSVAKPIIEEENGPSDLVLPEGNQWDVYITYIRTTNSVMMRLVGEEYSDKLDAYTAKLEESIKNSPPETSIIMGNLYIVHDDEDYYHRVRALSQEGRKVTCYFPDHGDTDWQIPDQLVPLDPEVNKLLPYQAIEVSLFGLEEIAENTTGISKLCDLALANTCVAEVVYRGDISSVILYDTSNDEDININEAILQAVKDEVGGIDLPQTLSPAPGSNRSPRTLSPAPGSNPSPRTLSPAPGSSPSTPVTVLSPVQSSTNITDSGKSDSSQNLYPSVTTDSQTSDSLRTKSSENLDTSQSLTERGYNQFDSPIVESSVGISSDLRSPKQSLDTLQNVVTDEIVTEGRISQHGEDKNMPRFSASWTNPNHVKDSQRDSKQVDFNSDVSHTEHFTKYESVQTTLNDNVINDLENLNLSNQNEDVPSLTNQYIPSNHVIDSEPMKTKEWPLDGRSIWNPAEYSKRPLPPSFEIPPSGEYLDIHVNFIHDPFNFVCIPYSMMNDLNQLLVDMIEYFHPTPPPIIKKEDVKVGHLYAGHKDGVWYRVKVKQFVNNDLVSVYLVDIGEYSVMMIDEIQPLPWTFWKLPLQAINAKLSCVQPVSGSWSEAAKYKFIDLAREKDLIGLILEHDRESGVVSFSLIDTSDSSVDLCIDECLVKMNYATYTGV